MYAQGKELGDWENDSEGNHVIYLSSDESDSAHEKEKRVRNCSSNMNKSAKKYKLSSSSSSLNDDSSIEKFFSKDQSLVKRHRKEIRSRKQRRCRHKITSTKRIPNDSAHGKRKHLEEHSSNMNKSDKKYKSSSSNSCLSDSSLEMPLSKDQSFEKRHRKKTPTLKERRYKDKLITTHFHEPIKEEKKESALDFYCRDCQLNLNCELTYKSHLAGRRHFKAIKVHHLNEIAKGSIELPANPPFVSLDKPRFEKPAAGRIRVRVSQKARLQKTVDNETRHPMPGLNYLLEIEQEKEISYYCQLCDAPCDPTTVMSHLIGSRHQMTCVRYIDKKFYKKVKHDETKFDKKELISILFRDQGKYGKQRIKVYKEMPDTRARLNSLDELYFDRPGPSWGTDCAVKQEDGETSDSVTSQDKYLDTSKADFCCTLCNSHMNNLTMWASHVRGQRHLKNLMKIPGESISKVKSIRASLDVVSELKGLLRNKEKYSVIVGLDYIRETQGPNGVMYNCFLCGAGSTKLDIVDHILLTKHRIKYLEKLQIDGIDNGISLIKHLDIGVSARDSLVKTECAEMQERFGKGTVEVYISKDVYRCSM